MSVHRPEFVSYSTGVHKAHGDTYLKVILLTLPKYYGNFFLTNCDVLMGRKFENSRKVLSHLH